MRRKIRYVKPSIFTPEQLARVYQLHQNGLSYNQIIAALALPGKYAAVGYVINALGKMLEGTKEWRRASDEYQSAYHILRGNLKISPSLTNGVDEFGKKASTPPQPLITRAELEELKHTLPEVQASTQDRFAILEQALETFQKSITTFIEEEVEVRTANLRQEYEDKMKQIEKLREEAKESNWVGVLRKKFNKDDL